LTLVFFLATHFCFSMHPVFLIFLAAIGIILIVEHLLVNPKDLSRINLAFFHMNSLVSLLLLAGVVTQSLL
ncbi:MAG: 4-hydroxybenzoate octaprenyltransferase, partial [Desulfovibrionales bacterium]|nr:4-hydroxybenzoate octaprenyltransferase [Desulfovibrionales bacterium]